jgi:hypothetical protein
MIQHHTRICNIFCLSLLSMHSRVQGLQDPPNSLTKKACSGVQWEANAHGAVLPWIESNKCKVAKPLFTYI